MEPTRQTRTRLIIPLNPGKLHGDFVAPKRPSATLGRSWAWQANREGHSKQWVFKCKNCYHCFGLWDIINDIMGCTSWIFPLDTKVNLPFFLSSWLSFILTIGWSSPGSVSPLWRSPSHLLDAMLWDARPFQFLRGVEGTHGSDLFLRQVCIRSALRCVQFH